MNERIKELMAGAVTFHLDPDSNAYEAQVSPEDLELFAELIIRECLNVINQPNGVGDDDVIRISRDVKEHFGVEE